MENAKHEGATNMLGVSSAQELGGIDFQILEILQEGSRTSCRLFVTYDDFLNILGGYNIDACVE